ncbi:hypothetical protein LXL04_029715 [Taraxacum kok-saghyz]
MLPLANSMVIIPFAAELDNDVLKVSQESEVYNNHQTLGIEHIKCLESNNKEKYGRTPKTGAEFQPYRTCVSRASGADMNDPTGQKEGLDVMRMLSENEGKRTVGSPGNNETLQLRKLASNYKFTTSTFDFSNMDKLGFFSFLLILLNIIQYATCATTNPTALDFVKTSCKTTRNQALRVNSLSTFAGAIKGNDQQLVKAAIAVSLNNAKSAAAFVSKLSGTSKVKSREYQALKDCVNSMASCVASLTQSIQTLGQMGKFRGKNLDWHMNSVQTWVSSALTDQNICTGGFSDSSMNGKVKDSVNKKMSSVALMTSNALALVFKFMRVLLITTIHASTDPAAMNYVTTSCKITRYSSLCIRCLSKYADSIQGNDLKLAKSAISVSLYNANSTTAYILKLAASSGLKPTMSQAVKDCVNNMNNCVSSLSQSIQELEKMAQFKGESFEWHMSNIKTWVSSALTNQNTCGRGFSDGSVVDGPVKDAVVRRMKYVAQLTSNALALVNRFALRHKAGTHMP